MYVAIKMAAVAGLPIGSSGPCVRQQAAAVGVGTQHGFERGVLSWAVGAGLTVLGLS